MGPFARWITFAIGGTRKRNSQFIAQSGKIALNPTFAANQHMVSAVNASGWQSFAQKRPEAALHAVANNRVADLLCDGYAKAQISFGSRHSTTVHQQHESGPCDPDSAIGGNKVRPFPNSGDSGHPRDRTVRKVFGCGQADSFLRPRERRAARILRPPGVAERVRKP